MKEIIDKTTYIDYLDTPSELHSYLKLAKPQNENPIGLFDNTPQPNNNLNLIYVDCNNRQGKTVSLYMIKDGLLANYMEIGTNANTFIVESAIDDIYFSNMKFEGNSNERIIVRKWLSREPDLGNKFEVTEDKSKLLKNIRNFISSCY